MRQVIQKILFGPPGAGKSYRIRDYYLKNMGIKNEDTITIGFHPEYKYGDFVGRLIPITKDNQVKYEFIPGPFLRILKDAYVSYIEYKNNQNNFKNHALIIEEINRGNAPAIFGDLILLLDRNEDGISEYAVNLPTLAGEWLYKNIKPHKNNNNGSDNDYLSKIADVISIEEETIKSIKLPPNLHLIATMNSSDESVFFLDSAFKRRWLWEYIDWNGKTIEDINTGEIEKIKFFEFFNDEELKIEDILKDGKIENDFYIGIGKTDENTLLESINNFLLKNNYINGREDKLIGRWFIKGAIKIKDIIKIINFKDLRDSLCFYLWDNIFRKNRQALEKEEIGLQNINDYGSFSKNFLVFLNKILSREINSREINSREINSREINSREINSREINFYIIKNDQNKDSINIEDIKIIKELIENKDIPADTDQHERNTIDYIKDMINQIIPIKDVAEQKSIKLDKDKYKKLLGDIMAIKDIIKNKGYNIQEFIDELRKVRFIPAYTERPYPTEWWGQSSDKKTEIRLFIRYYGFFIYYKDAHFDSEEGIPEGFSPDKIIYHPNHYKDDIVYFANIKYSQGKKLYSNCSKIKVYDSFAEVIMKLDNKLIVCVDEGSEAGFSRPCLKYVYKKDLLPIEKLSETFITFKHYYEKNDNEDNEIEKLYKLYKAYSYDRSKIQPEMSYNPIEELYKLYELYKQDNKELNSKEQNEEQEYILYKLYFDDYQDQKIDDASIKALYKVYRDYHYCNYNTIDLQELFNKIEDWKNLEESKRQENLENLKKNLETNYKNLENLYEFTNYFKKTIEDHPILYYFTNIEEVNNFISFIEEEKKNTEAQIQEIEAQIRDIEDMKNNSQTEDESQ